jgi:threonine dehydrogenase-like Zn-dependent dehydrogenase
VDATVEAERIMALTLHAATEQPTIPNMMRAAVLSAPRDIRPIERPVPRPGPGEVLVQVAMCGTCGSDLKVYDGQLPRTLPCGEFTPGHEWTGTVVAAGETVDEVAVGTGCVSERTTAAVAATIVSLAGTRRV